MAKRSLRLILPVLAALGVACGRDPCCGPEPRVLTRLEVTPTDFALSTVAPGNTLQLTIWPYDQAGAPMPRTGAVTYSSSAPAIVGVSSSGVVTAAAPGTAVITATLTLGGITRTASMTATVHGDDDAPGAVFTTLGVSPTVANLFTVAPGNTVQLSIGAWDQTGARMPDASATYSSSAPAIAGVSSSGVVTAAAPGTAVITATLTLGGITRTASMTATVQERPPVFTTLVVRPIVAHLFDIAPGNTVQLSVATYGSTGLQFLDSGAAIYSSSDPAIAWVSSGGVVTAAAPGMAVITATLTLGGTTWTAVMTATVHRGEEAPGPYPEIAGVYDLTALITNSDPAWGIEDGTRQTAVITIRHPRDTSAFAGTYADFRAIAPSGESVSGNPGFVTGSIDLDGRVVIELFTGQSQSSYWYGRGMLASRQIVGEFGAGGHISGTFTAERR